MINSSYSQCIYDGITTTGTYIIKLPVNLLYSTVSQIWNTVHYLFIGYGEGAQAPSNWSWSHSNGDMKQVMDKTSSDLKNGYYTLGGKKVDLLSATNACAKNTVKQGAVWSKSSFRGLFADVFSSPIKTEFSVIDKDAIEVAIDLKKQGFNPALLNPANAYGPGGGYKDGSRAMEEDICRRSGLSYAIDSCWQKVKNFYPLKNSELLYNPNVPIFRNGRSKHYSYLEKPVEISVITSAAIDLNPRHKGDKKYHNDKKLYLEETTGRIYAQLKSAADNKHDAVVLTAFGCGAFRNEPDVVAKIYKDVTEKYFSGVFKNVTFAVINDHNTGYAHNPQGNFAPFEAVFG